MTLDDYNIEFKNLFSEFKIVSHVIPSKLVEGFMTYKEFRDNVGSPYFSTTSKLSFKVNHSFV